MNPLYDHLDQEAQQLLSQRTQQLSQQAFDQDALEENLTVAILQLPPERYAVPIHQVREIEKFRPITRIPGLDTKWCGIVNLRGSMYTVLDLRRYLGLAAGEMSQHEKKIALLQGEEMSLGILVDQVEEIRQIPVSQITPAPRIASGVRPESIRGVTPDMITVLDVDGLLADPSLRIGKEADNG
jgi:purine-binding chemotaxis protein CheW